MAEIEEEERKRSEVRELSVNHPSHRANLSLHPHPGKRPNHMLDFQYTFNVLRTMIITEHGELVMFGGEFYNGQKTLINNELLFYQIKRKEWTQVQSDW